MKTPDIKICAILLSFIVFCIPSHCESMSANTLVDRFYEATEVQRDEVRKLYIGENIIAGGIVSNVEDSRFFNTKDRVRENYFTVKTEVQNTGEGNPYQVVFFYKNADDVKNLNKGEGIEKYGRLLKIVDRGLWIYLWIEVE
ncbi:MAG: hypothetical protein WBC74_01705 [Candidatus Omnitrophota bacterium]